MDQKTLDEIKDCNLSKKTKQHLALFIDKATGDADIVASLEDTIKELKQNKDKDWHFTVKKTMNDVINLLEKIRDGKLVDKNQV